MWSGKDRVVSMRYLGIGPAELFGEDFSANPKLDKRRDAQMYILLYRWCFRWFDGYFTRIFMGGVFFVYNGRFMVMV